MTKIIKLKPADLSFDPAYQREVVRTHLAKLAESFSPDLVGTLTVSRRPTGDFVIDGQHRTQAAILAGHGATSLSCVVHTGLTQAQEAQMFLDLNRVRKPILKVNEWNAGLAAGDPAIIGQSLAIERAGWKVNPTSTAIGQISAIAALARIRQLDRNGDLDLTYRTLRLLTDAWGMGPEVANGHLLNGTAIFLARYGETVDAPSLSAKLRKEYDATRIIGTARNWLALHGGTVANALAAVLVQEYNRGRASKNRLIW